MEQAPKLTTELQVGKKVSYLANAFLLSLFLPRIIRIKSSLMVDLTLPVFKKSWKMLLVRSPGNTYAFVLEKRLILPNGSTFAGFLFFGAFIWLAEILVSFCWCTTTMIVRKGEFLSWEHIWKISWYRGVDNFISNNHDNVGTREIQCEQ